MLIIPRDTKEKVIFGEKEKSIPITHINSSRNNGQPSAIISNQPIYENAKQVNTLERSLGSNNTAPYALNLSKISPNHSNSPNDKLRQPNDGQKQQRFDQQTNNFHNPFQNRSSLNPQIINVDNQNERQKLQNSNDTFHTSNPKFRPSVKGRISPLTRNVSPYPKLDSSPSNQMHNQNHPPNPQFSTSMQANSIQNTKTCENFSKHTINNNSFQISTSTTNIVSTIKNPFSHRPNMISKQPGSSSSNIFTTSSKTSAVALKITLPAQNSDSVNDSRRPRTSYGLESSVNGNNIIGQKRPNQVHSFESSSDKKRRDDFDLPGF